MVSPGLVAALPPAIQVDRLLIQAERETGDNDYAAAVATFDRILVLQKEHGLQIPAAFWFKYAHVSQEAGLYAQAAESATRYLNEAGNQGEHYLEALRVLDAAEQEHKRQEAEEKMGQFAGEMVSIPGDTFYMGDLNGGGYDDERPVHSVTVSDFKIGKYEVTFDQWDTCVADGGCGGYRPDDEGWGRGARPVINVSWYDAQGFIDWLNSKTGGNFRLPTEAEWEYTARAGNATKYSWGNSIGSNRANCNGCGSQWDGERTAPAGSFSANAWGLHDVLGNVDEWVQDCWNDSYAGAPSDGRVWTGGDCSRRGLRGGSWYNNTRSLRSAGRHGYTRSNRFHNLGFRLVQDK